MFIGMSVYWICDNQELAIESHVFGLLASIFAMVAGSYLFPNKPEETYELS